MSSWLTLNKNLIFLSTFLLLTCCTVPEIELPYDLECALDEEYDEYVKCINNSISGDKEALYKILTFGDLYDGAGFEHGWMLLMVLDKIGDENFSKGLAKLKSHQLVEAESYILAGLDIFTNSDELILLNPETLKSYWCLKNSKVLIHNIELFLS